MIEPAAGVDRAALAFLLDAYTVDEALNAKGQMEKRTVLKLHKDLAPIKVAACRYRGPSGWRPRPARCSTC